jgi:PKD repeat protein
MSEKILQVRKNKILQWDKGVPMGDNFANMYRKSYKNWPALLILALFVFITILFCPTVASAVVDVTLAWDASSGADGYRLFYREDGQNYDYSSRDWEGTGTTCIIPGLDESTTYHFVVRAFNDNGESGNSNEEHLYPGGANQAPTASFTANPTSGDAPLSVSFNAFGSSDPDGSIVSYDWDFGDGGGSGVSASHTYTSAGTYTVTLAVTDNDGAIDTATRQIQVTSASNQSPTASFTASPTSGDAPLTVSFDGSGSSDPDGTIVSYGWDFGDGGGSGVSASHTYTSAGTYTVSLTVTDDDGATDSSSNLIQVTDPQASNLPPNQPVISSPYQDELETDLLLSVKTESFSDPDGDAHSMSQWQVVKQSDSSVVLEIESSEHLTKLPVPHAVLDRGSTYSVSVQFVDAHSEPSEWSDPVVFTTITNTVDLDDDGIPDGQEVDDTVDLNEDGIPDNDQPDTIKSAKSAVGGKKPLGICKIATNVEGIVVLEPIHPSEILDKKNKPKKFLHGLAAYRLKLNQVGATTEVKVYYSEDISGATRYYLYDTVNGWQDYTQYTTFNPDGRSVTVELKDGGHGDSDGVENGIIVDPGGVAGAASGGDIGAGGGCFIATAAASDSYVEPHAKLQAEKYSEDHDWLQPIVRILLMPLVGLLLIISLFSFHTLIYRRRIPKV